LQAKCGTSNQPITLDVNIGLVLSSGELVKTTVSLLAQPPTEHSKSINLDGAEIPCNGTVFPNALPATKEIKKPCQDNFTILHDDDKILLCLFDGHGRSGEVIVQYLIDI
jgi:hypothetical protein